MSRLFHLELKQQQIPTILLSQAIDTTVGLCLGLFFAMLVGVFFSGQQQAQALGFSWLLFFSGLMLAWSLNFFQRLFFVSFLGATLGQFMTGVRALVAPADSKFWVGQAVESLHLILPMIWIIETAQRFGLDSPFRGIRYRVVRQHAV